MENQAAVTWLPATVANFWLI